MKRRIIRLTLIAVPILVVVIAVQLALWGSRGGLVTVIRGQFEPAPDLTAYRDAPVRSPAGAAYSVVVERGSDSPVHRISTLYISFAIDSSQVVGGKWWNPEADTKEDGSGTVNSPILDWEDEQLNYLTAALAPAYLRIGGSEADKILYDMNSDAERVEGAPGAYESVMTRRQWDAVNRFAARHELRLLMCLNAGPSARDASGVWQPDNARELIAYSAEQGHDVAIWEMGNELNLYWYIYGRDKVVTAEQYHRDLQVGKALVAEYYPQTRFAGQGSAFWPVLGEPLQLFYGFQEDFMRRSGQLVDLVAWHYYPQQSRRGPIASRRASPSRLLEPDHLDEAAHWATLVRDWRDRFAPGRELWIGETGNAQFGGEPGVSSAYIGGLWWLDHLGLMAVHGHDVIVRQTLTGMDYGMIDERTMRPRPDYWNSLLWRSLMTGGVLGARVAGSERLRAYWHRQADGSETLLAINLEHDRPAEVTVPGFANRATELYMVTTDDVLGETVLLNGAALTAPVDRSPTLPRGQAAAPIATYQVRVPPLAYAFIVARP